MLQVKYSFTNRKLGNKHIWALFAMRLPCIFLSVTSVLMSLLPHRTASCRLVLAVVKTLLWLREPHLVRAFRMARTGKLANSSQSAHSYICALKYLTFTSSWGITLLLLTTHLYFKSTCSGLWVKVLSAVWAAESQTLLFPRVGSGSPSDLSRGGASPPGQENEVLLGIEAKPPVVTAGQDCRHKPHFHIPYTLIQWNSPET